MKTVTLSDLKKRCRFLSNMENSTFVTDSELLDYINSSYTELYDLLVTSFEDYNLLSTTITITSGSTSPLPSDFYKLKGLDLKSGNDWLNVTRFAFNKRNEVNNSIVYSNLDANVYYRIIGDNLFIEPADRAIGEYKMWYIPVTPELTLDDDTVDGVNGFEEYIILDVAIKMLMKEESTVSHLERQLLKMQNRIETMSKNRDSGTPDKITDVTNDDPYRIF